MEQSGDDVLVWVKAVAGASRDEIADAVGQRLKIRVSVPAQAGRANQAVCVLLARALGAKPRDISIESGQASPQKTVRIRGARLDLVKAALVLREPP